MNKLKFNNFRRFPSFGPISYKEITFLVGRNNSGKSSFVKAIMIFFNFLKSSQLDSLNFNENNVEDLNIVTYNRAKCKSNKANEGEFIDFEFEIDNLSFYIKVTGNQDQIKASIMEFTVIDASSGFRIFINPSTNFINFQWIRDEKDFLSDTIEQLKLTHDQKSNERKSIVDKLSEEYILLNSEINNLKVELSNIRKSSQKDSKNKIYLSAHYKKNSLPLVLDEIIIHFKSQYDVRFKENQALGGKPFKDKTKQADFESLRVFYQNLSKIDDFLNSIKKLIENYNIKYLPATLSKQSALFSIRDEKNALARAVHEYQELGIQKSEGDAKKFVNKWIKEDNFEIGDSFEISLIAGEAYEFNVFSNGISIPLADKGMGSIQAMLLILRIATIIHKKEKNEGIYTLIVEEPELNLHPALQGKLCDMFYEANQKFHIQFIVETHSEYIIRKSQLFVSIEELENDINENPFSVIYFDKDLTKAVPVWNMIYRQDGSFENNFGAGFFDAAVNSTLQLLKLKREKQA